MQQGDEQRLDCRAVMADAVIAAWLARGRVLQPVQRALASKHGQHRVMPQLVVVVQILVAERDAEHALADQGGYLVLDPLR
jgi:hypothetical protein